MTNSFLRCHLKLSLDSIAWKWLRNRMDIYIRRHMDISAFAPPATRQKEAFERVYNDILNDDKIVARFFPDRTRETDLKLLRQNIGIRTNELRTSKKRLVKLDRMRQNGSANRGNLSNIESDWDSDAEKEGVTTTKRPKRRAVVSDRESLSDEVVGLSFPSARKTTKKAKVAAPKAVESLDNPELLAVSSRSESVNPYASTPPNSVLAPEPPAEQAQPLRTIFSSAVDIATDELYQFLSTVCNPPIPHLYADLTRFGCGIEHIRAMGTWSESRLSSVLGTIRVQTMPRGLMVGVSNDEGIEEAVRAEEGPLVNYTDGKTTLMDWEVLKYHILRI
ncbi:hypothetical protein BDN72DRAFT_339189 [Pluteus cervinus]|uniref:Uncharacterized protein n=1 Tax=Pluteus cervinus TaxID=181527 RepID=A0ACD3ABS5_9AGAR|nr:hypothetical protein BDN72DRAFT_339189 [Pluteus cervinus]